MSIRCNFKEFNFDDFLNIEDFNPKSEDNKNVKIVIYSGQFGDASNMTLFEVPIDKLKAPKTLL